MSLLAQLKILVVDDTTTSRMLLRDALETIGFRNIAVAADGEQAMQVMMSQPCHLIISDMNMPKMNGLQLLHAIRTYKPTSRTPFMILTGNNDKNVLIEGRKMGLNNYLNKPFTTPDLKKALEAIVGRLH
ncbi:response regulator [Aquibium sp. ELW1220]|jgi:two-component system chemotaxis response regulator CheY|uniref:response regulator n=1 Tax=Aquibium sp. ELW1220 TaxID=2976766 RepID=UPI0025B0449F|nr:response regulator [Aquibium sp. ELW1220]MDN2580853.1 response regulator [Aquibium sp. ELW1220]